MSTLRGTIMVEGDDTGPSTMDRIRRLADAASEPDRFASLLDHVRTEHRAKRNLKKLLDAKGW